MRLFLTDFNLCFTCYRYSPLTTFHFRLTYPKCVGLDRHQFRVSSRACPERNRFWRKQTCTGGDHRPLRDYVPLTYRLLGRE